MQYQVIQPQGFPVPISPPNQSMMVPQQNLPNNPPFAIQVQVHPHFQQFIPLFTGGVILALQQNMGKNYLRSFHFNLLSSNGWNNQEIVNTVNTAAKIFEFLMATQSQRGMQPLQALEMAVNDAVMFNLVDNVGRFSQGLQQFIDQQLANDLNGVANRAQQVMTQVNQFFQQAQGGMNRGYGAPAPVYGAGPVTTTMSGGNVPSWMQTGGQGGGVPMGGYNAAPVPVPAHLAGGYNPNPGNLGGGLRYAGPQAHAPVGGGMFGPVAAPAVTGNQMGTGLKRRVQRKQVEDVSTDTNLELTMAPDGGRTVKAWSSSAEAERLAAEAGTNRNRLPEANNPFTVTAPFADNAPSNLLPGQTTEGVTYSTEPTPAPESWPKFINPERPYDGMILEDGTEMRPASKSGWKITFSPDKPYRTIYDPTQLVLFHVKRPDGTVLERLEPRSDDMNYLDHELDPALRRVRRDQETANGPQVVPTWGLAERMKQIPEKSVAVMAPEPEAAEGEAAPVDTSDDLSTELKPRTLDVVAQVHSRGEALVRLSVLTNDKSINPSQESPAEFYFEEITPVVTDKNVINIVRSLEGITSFEELNAKLNEYDHLFSTEVKTVLDKRLTAAVVQALQKNMGLDGWAIDSYLADYDDLITALRSNFGGTDTLVDAFHAFAPVMIGQSVAVLGGDSYTQYAKTVYSADDDSKLGDTLLAFRDRCSITQVPWNFADLRIDLNGGGVISEAAMPQLYAAVRAIFSRTEDYPVTWARRYLCTADKKLIELRHGFLGGDDVFLMFDAK